MPKPDELLIPAITDWLPNRIWTYGEMGDRDVVLEWRRIGGGWRTTFPDGTPSGAMSTRELQQYYRPFYGTDPRIEKTPELRPNRGSAPRKEA